MNQTPESIFFKKLVSLILNLDFNIPNKSFLICHYTSAVALKNILEEQTLRFTRWDFLNDESEMVHIHEIVKNCLKKKKYPKKFKELILSTNDLMVETRNVEINKDLKNDYILSFSINPDSLPMWSCYTKNNQSDGYNIDFDATILMPFLSKIPNIETSLVKLIYKSDEKKRIVNEFLDNLYEMYVNIGYAPNRSDVVFLCFKSSINMLSKYFKHDAFEYENEYRIIANAPIENEKVIEKNGVFVPYIELGFPKKSVKYVNISPTLSKRNPQIGLRTLLENNGYDCDIIYSTIPFRNI